MKKLAFLILILFVGALQQQLIVDLSFDEQGNGQIQDYVRTQGENPNSRFGSWTLQLRDTSLVVSQTQFSPIEIDGQGTTRYLDELSIAILAPAGAQTIELVDEDGTIVDARSIQNYCGDGLCAVSERSSCTLDCAPESTAAYTTQTQQPLEAVPQRGFGFWAIILTIILLIVVLIFALIHLNRNKENPVQMQSQY